MADLDASLQDYTTLQIIILYIFECAAYWRRRTITVTHRQQTIGASFWVQFSDV